MKKPVANSHITQYGIRNTQQTFRIAYSVLRIFQSAKILPFILIVFAGLMLAPLPAQQPDTSAAQPASKAAADTSKTTAADTAKAAADTSKISRQDTTKTPATPAAITADTAKTETTTVKAADSLKAGTSGTPPETSQAETPPPDTAETTPQQNTGGITPSNAAPGSPGQRDATGNAPSSSTNLQTSQSRPETAEESTRQPQSGTADTDTVSEAGSIGDELPAEGGAAAQPQTDEGGGIPGWLFWVAGLLVVGAIFTVVFLRRAKTEGSFFETPPAAAIPQPAGKTRVVMERYIISHAQHDGGRPEQQDAFAISEPETESSHRGLLMVLADGMSGHAWGREASRAAVRTFRETYITKSAEESIAAALKRSLKAANDAVTTLARERQQENNVGATLTAAAIDNENLHWIAVGDSRIYLFSENQLTQLTTDHIYLNKLLEQVSGGKLGKKEASKHPDRDALYSFLGLKKVTEIDSNPKPHPLKSDDRILLCSEGVHKTLSKTEIAEELAGNPNTLGDSIIRRALAKENPEQENLTALVLVVK